MEECHNFKNTHIFRKKNCKDLGISQDLLEFVKILALESLKFCVCVYIYIYIYLKNGYFKNFDMI